MAISATGTACRNITVFVAKPFIFIKRAGDGGQAVTNRLIIFIPQFLTIGHRRIAPFNISRTAFRQTF